jgi:hypothetical protein
MKQILGRVFSFALVGATVGGIAPACVDNDQSIYVRGALAPPTNRQNNECIYQPDPTAPFLPEGLLDVAATDSYTIHLLVGNQMNPRGDQSNTRAESNRAHLNGAVVTVTNPDGGEIGSFTATGTGFVDPQVGTTAAFGILQVTVIDAATSAKIGSQLGGFTPGPGQPAPPQKLVLANIKAFGTTLGGVDLESGTFQFPIRVCKGCSIVFADDPATPGVDCNLPLTTAGGSGASQVVIPCQPGQDEVTPCQTCITNPACQGKAIP